MTSIYKSTSRVTILLSGVAILLWGLASACDFNPSAPFEAFDGLGSRVSGRFMSESGPASGLRAAPQSTFDGITVHVEQDTSITTTVKSNGTFTLEGLPDGIVTLVFTTESRVTSRINLSNVRPNQEIRIVVELSVNLRVVLVSQDRDDSIDDYSDDSSDEHSDDFSDDSSDDSSDNSSDNSSDSSSG